MIDPDSRYSCAKSSLVLQITSKSKHPRKQKNPKIMTTAKMVKMDLLYSIQFVNMFLLLFNLILISSILDFSCTFFKVFKPPYIPFVSYRFDLRRKLTNHSPV